MRAPTRGLDIPSHCACCLPMRALTGRTSLSTLQKVAVVGKSYVRPKEVRRGSSTVTRIWPFDVAWDVDNQTLASNIFATSIFPYAGFLYHLQKSKKAPRLMLFGFYFLLVFVLATIVAGVYAKLQYKSTLANVDWLHGSAESFLTLTNLLIVLGLRQGIQEAQRAKEAEETKEN